MLQITTICNLSLIRKREEKEEKLFEVDMT